MGVGSGRRCCTRRCAGSPGRLPALLAGAVLALTPVAALMFRFNNPDALLVLLMVAAAYATVRAIEKARDPVAAAGRGVHRLRVPDQDAAGLRRAARRSRWPTWSPRRPAFWRRIRQLLAAGVAVVVAAGWWVAIVELWPAAAGPYIGGSQNNSVLELALGYNGLGRIFGQGAVAASAEPVGLPAGDEPAGRVRAADPGGGGGGGGFGGQAGLTRLFNDRDRRPDLLAAAGRAGAAGRRAVADPARPAHRPAARLAAALGRLDGGHRAGLQPVPRASSTPTTRWRSRPGIAALVGDRRARSCGGTGHVAGPDHACRVVRRHRGVGLGAARPHARLPAVAALGDRRLRPWSPHSRCWCGAADGAVAAVGRAGRGAHRPRRAHRVRRADRGHPAHRQHPAGRPGHRGRRDGPGRTAAASRARGGSSGARHRPTAGTDVHPTPRRPERRPAAAGRAASAGGPGASRSTDPALVALLRAPAPAGPRPRSASRARVDRRWPPTPP